MAIKKKGANTGWQDINGTDILIGDRIRALSTGRVYEVNKYGMPFNRETGGVKFGIIGDVEIVYEEAETAPVKVIEREDDLQIINCPEAPAPQEDEDETEVADLEEREDAPDDGDTVTREDFAVLLRTFPDDLIAEELARRGFHGRLTGENGTIQLTDEGSAEECDLTNADLVRILRERGCKVTATQPITVYQQL